MGNGLRRILPMASPTGEIVIGAHVEYLQILPAHPRHPGQGKAVDVAGHHDIGDQQVERLRAL